MKSSNSVTYSKRNSVINTNIEKLVEGSFSPGSMESTYTVVVPNDKTRNTNGIFKMIMGLVYFISLVYFLTRLLT